MKNEVYLHLAEKKELTTYHYKVILLLLGNTEFTQVVMADMLGTSKQNVNRICKDLLSMDIIQKKRTVGRNIYWSINPSPRFGIKGQLCIDDVL